MLQGVYGEFDREFVWDSHEWVVLRAERVLHPVLENGFRIFLYRMWALDSLREIHARHFHIIRATPLLRVLHRISAFEPHNRLVYAW